MSGIQRLTQVYIGSTLLPGGIFMSTTQAIKLDDETNNRLKALAQKRNRSAHWLLRDALQRYLAEEERYEREKAEDLAEYEDSC
jgi:predicted transcriptional regulator